MLRHLSLLLEVFAASPSMEVFRILVCEMVDHVLLRAGSPSCLPGAELFPLVLRAGQAHLPFPL